jgi:hypothetical protein
MGMNAGNWGALEQGGEHGMEEGQRLQKGNLENQKLGAEADDSRRQDQSATENFNAAKTKINTQGGLDTGTPGQGAQVGTNFQQSGNVFDPMRTAIFNGLSHIGQAFKSAFGSPGPAAQGTVGGPGQPGARAPAAASAPQPGASGPPTPPPPNPNGPQQGPPQPGMAEGGAIPGRKLQGIRAKKGKPGNVAKATAGDKQVANQQPGAGGPPMAMQQSGPPRNTEPNQSNQTPQLANGGKPPKKGKAARSKGLAGTVDKFKEGGKVPFPKLEPGAAPAPKPAPNSLEQTVNNDGMRHYLGKTIKRFAGGGEADKDAPVPTPAGAQASDTQPVPTPAGMKPMGDPKEPSLFDRAVTGIKNFASDPSDKSLAERAGFSGGTNSPPAALQGPSAQPAPEPAATPSPVPNRGAQPNYTPAAPGKVPDAQKPDTQQVESGGYDQNVPDPNALPGEIGRGRDVARAAHAAGAGSAPDGQQPAPATAGAQPQQGPQQGPANPQATDTVDFSKVKADQSQVPTVTTEQWQQMKNGIVNMAVAHGKSGGEAEMAANEEVSKYQHGNFMQYMQQAQALNEAGNKQAAMAALKTGYQFFETGHDMHFGLDPATNDIIGYGINEKTGQPVQNGSVRLNSQGLAGIISHFADPKNFVEEGLRMQEQANKDAETKSKVGLEHAQATHAIAGAHFLDNRNATTLAVGQGHDAAREYATAFKSLHPDIQKFYADRLKDLPNAGDAQDVAGQLESQAPGGVDEAHRLRILGIVRHMFDSNTDPGVREKFMRDNHLTDPGQQQPPAQSGTPVRNRNDAEDGAATFNALNGQ